ncbi:hypothetical protein QGX11_gp049 [Pseudomonas phage PPSC2]|uniref:Uncharacterized protein n=1 Tax=Pseudomonas phage PPSC2 TaxID=2041350 RepID=A0A2R2YAZ6_9CAUD|nr:hypothetical protein QGX11_gp049 [Pseudomonas phage PPSC2]ATN92812.1 hypothetical protein PPSC2_49 [Pseudomonas phage PPSC2]
MADKYGIEEFKELIEAQIKKLNNPMECPFGMDPYGDGQVYRKAQQGILNWVVEMMPEINQ